MTDALLRNKVVNTGRRLYALGFVPAADGNLSVRLKNGSVLLTPSGVSKGNLKPGELAVISSDGKHLRGPKPSSEYLLHLSIYKARPDIMAVIHAHPPVSTGFAACGFSLEEPLTSELVITLGRVPLAPYATPGTSEVAQSVAKLVKMHEALLLANHGAVTYAGDLETAFRRMETVEQAAKIALIAKLLGGGKTIPAKRVRLLEAIGAKLRGI